MGVSKAYAGDLETRSGHVKGKYGYMAPELLSGGDFDRRADIYSAGVVAWELLTACKLFPLRGAHSKAKCRDCHTEAEGMRRFVDTPSACADCHTEQHDGWQGSTHGRAGGTPSTETVVAPFDGTPIVFADECVGCGLCAELCPVTAIEMAPLAEPRTFELGVR